MSYDSEVAADSPQIYWKLQDTSGTSATDSSGNSRAGTYAGTSGTHFKLDQSVSLLPAYSALKSVMFTRDGTLTTAKASINDASTNCGKGAVYRTYEAWMNVAGSAFSAECWFQVPSTLTRYVALHGLILAGRRKTYPLQWQMALTGFGAAPSCARWEDRLNVNNSTQQGWNSGFYLRESAVDAVTGGDSTTGYEQVIDDYVPGDYAKDLFDDTPHHIVMACGTASIRTYLDGVLAGAHYTSGVPAIASNTSDPVCFAGYHDTTPTSGFIGYLSHCAHYGSELSAARVAAHYTAGFGNVVTLNQQWALYAAQEMALSTTAGWVTTATPITAMSMLHSDSSAFSTDLMPALRQAVSLATSATVTPTLTPQQAIGVAFLDSASIAQQLTASKFGTILLNEAAALTAAFTVGQKTSMNLSDIITAAVIIKAGDDEMVGWIINPNLAASTMLDNYAFSGFGTHKGKRYGIRPDGLYVLEGDTDAGTNIDSFISLGNRNFNTAKMKRVPHAYIGASTDGRMVLKVIVGGQEYLYAVRNHSTDMGEQRVDIGRGLRSNYWNFELMNREGADFEIDTIKFMPIVLERRI